MRLFVGLGNPGSKYQGNRHNIGFMALDQIAWRHRFPSWRQGFCGLVSKGRIDSEDVVLLKPETFMNESGRAVREAVNFFKLRSEDVVVFHDEIELPPGKVRVKVGGTDAGHNGLRSITMHLGPKYYRVRLGVDHPRSSVGSHHPGLKEFVYRYVLSDFGYDERPWVEALCDIVADNAGLIAKGKDSIFANKVHLAMQAKGFYDNDKGEPKGSNK